MSLPHPAAPRRELIAVGLLLLLCVTAYFGPAMQTNRPNAMRGHFVELAGAFLRGELSFVVRPETNLRLGELIPVERDPRRAFCAYPPLPAILLMPFIAIVGPGITVESATRWVSVLNVLILMACLSRLPQRMNRPALSLPGRWGLAAFFALGTAMWSNADIGGDWHLAHAVATGALLLALNEFTRSNRPAIVSTFIGLAILSRPTMAFTGLFFILESVGDRNWRRVSQLIAGPALAIGLLAAYNMARFGHPMDFAYNRMILNGDGDEFMKRFGQFNIAFVPRNLFWYFLAPPWPLASQQFPWFGYDPRGMSIFLASPAWVLAVRAAIRDRKERVIRSATLAASLCLLPLVLYFNTGFWQFGSRFSMDYLPLWVVLMAAHFHGRISRTAAGLMLLSVFIHVIAIVLQPIATIPINIPPMGL